MSFTEDKRDSIKQYMLEKIDDNVRGFAKKTAEAFQISLNTVYRYVHELEHAMIIEQKDGNYQLTRKDEIITLDRERKDLQDEDAVYREYIRKYTEFLPDNVQKIWQYSFMEMMNNAIDHSEAPQVFVYVCQTALSTIIQIVDNGVGIFRKIKDYYHYNTLDDAVNELFKGKLTTDSKNHSGEGIFFTSRVLDRFVAYSDGKIFSHDKFRQDLSDIKDNPLLKFLENRAGTVIFMELSNHSNRSLKEVFDMFADVDGGFTKTHIPIKNIFDTFPVSRSQAKRLCNRFDRFQEIELDFEGVEEIGQGFAHEIFVVFQNAHENIKLIPVNTSTEVQRMIHHVLH